MIDRSKKKGETERKIRRREAERLSRTRMGAASCAVSSDSLARRPASLTTSLPYTASIVYSRLDFGAVNFCRTHSTRPSVFDNLHQGEVRFSDTGDLEVVGRGGKVMLSAGNSVAAAVGCGIEDSGRGLFAGD